MSKISTVVRLLRESRQSIFFPLFQKIRRRGLLDLLSDKAFLRIAYWCVFGEKLNLKEPKSFNEKLNYLKLYDRRPEYIQCVDKIAVKDYVQRRIGAQYIIATYGIWDDASEIAWDDLPQKFVLKASNGSGGHDVIICKSKDAINKEKCVAQLNHSISIDYSGYGREWMYKEFVPRILAEELIEPRNNDLEDYKIHCFNGEPKFILVCRDRYSDTGLTEDFFDTNWNLMTLERPGCKHSEHPIQKPSKLEEMLIVARKLSEGIPFVRVDLYQCDEKVLFGEMTFFPASGLKPFCSKEWDLKLGSWLDL